MQDQRLAADVDVETRACRGATGVAEAHKLGYYGWVGGACIRVTRAMRALYVSGLRARGRGVWWANIHGG